jgi:hypothetical protein
MSRTFLVTALLPLLLAGCAPSSAAPLSSPSPRCTEARDLAAVYTCAGECIAAGNGAQKVVTVSGEKSTISVYPGTTAGLFQVAVVSGSKTETEIGGLAGMVLHTATSAVSDNKFPVLEEYFFDVDAQCQATGFTKLVRNPNPVDFLACNIRCKK